MYRIKHFFAASLVIAMMMAFLPQDASAKCERYRLVNTKEMDVTVTVVLTNGLAVTIVIPANSARVIPAPAGSPCIRLVIIRDRAIDAGETVEIDGIGKVTVKPCEIDIC